MKVNANKLKIAMANACMSVDDLANTSGVSRLSIAYYINGKREPHTKTLGKVARALNVPVTDLIDTETVEA